MPAPEHPAGTQEKPGLFATTHWSLVLAVRDHADSADAAAEALGKLCQTYWYPVYAHIRRRGYGAEFGEERVQPYYAMRYVEGHSLDRELAAGPMPAQRAAELVATSRGRSTSPTSTGCCTAI